MINNSAPQKWQRLRQKNLDNLFNNRLQQGLNCSPFEAECIIKAMYETYESFFDNAASLKPGQIIYQAIDANTPPGISLSESKKVNVILTLDGGEEDLEIRKKHGVIGLRRHKLERICNESYEQGGVLTVEDIANRLLNCGERTLVRDIKAFKDKGVILPLRSTIQDMGRSFSHRTIIVEKWLAGAEYSDISRSTNHSVASVKNYIDKFKRVISLVEQNYDYSSVAFLAKLSQPLVKELHKVYQNADIVIHRRDELNDLLKRKKK